MRVESTAVLLWQRRATHPPVVALTTWLRLLTQILAAVGILAKLSRNERDLPTAETEKVEYA